MEEGIATMSKTNFSNKCAILGSLWTFYKDTDNEGWRVFFDWADLGCPMAYLQWQGMVTIKADTKPLVEDTWDKFCDMISIDPDGSYENLKAAFDASPNDPIK
jgi:hypothetical protein